MPQIMVEQDFFNELKDNNKKISSVIVAALMLTTPGMENIIRTALKSAIHAHGPITDNSNNINSASKRIYGQMKSFLSRHYLSKMDIERIYGEENNKNGSKDS